MHSEQRIDSAKVCLEGVACGGFPLVPLAAAILAAAVAWPVVERFHAHYQPSAKAAAEAYNFGPLNAETKQANAKNGAICFGALGGLLGLALGLAGGLGRRSGGWAAVAAVVGGILGVAAGALPALPLMPEAHEHKDAMLTQPAIGLGIHLGLWVPLGAVAGLAYALGRYGLSPRHLVLGLVGGFLGTALGTLFYEVVGAVALPMHATHNPFASLADAAPGDWNATRLFSLICVGLGSATGAVVALRDARRTREQAQAGLTEGENRPAAVS
ncbi:MAG: hypothetical protein KatS3mg108_0909 [Isosphaeraceae bacterium]|jgi:hypothetical protein|nr:MAG: hypothetical protein KatS3mg108_0909 [Isosphaeraceae bacterium]